MASAQTLSNRSGRRTFWSQRGKGVVRAVRPGLSRMINSVLTRLPLGAIFCAMLLTAGYFLFVNTAWGHSVDNIAYHGRKALAHPMVEYGDRILDAVSKVTLVLGALVILVIGLIRRSLAVAVLAVMGYGSAVVGAEVLKHILPWHPLVPTDASLPIALQEGSYPSGHATIGVSLAVAFVLISAARWRLWLAMLSGFVSASFATGVLFVGWHRPSDALGGIAWSGFCMSLAAAAAVIFRGRQIRSLEQGAWVLIGNALLAAVVIALAWTAAGGEWNEHHGAEGPFLALTLLIIAASFSLTAWFAWELRHVDW